MTTQIERSRQYRNYLNSAAWHKRRRQRLLLADGKCEFCPTLEYKWHLIPGDRCSSTDRLEVHHLHYNTLGHEADSDLEVLCRKHHILRHVMETTCEWCDEPIYHHEDDAIAAVESAVDLYGINNLTLECVFVSSLCDYHDHVLNKDD